ncbi:41339_t:CDS:1, partial [Gigaspora margarita]
TPEKPSEDDEMKPTKSDVTKPIKCNEHMQKSKDDNEINAMKLPKCQIHTSKL